MSRPAVGVVGLILFVALLGVGTRWAVPHVEDTLRVESEQKLNALAGGGSSQVDFEGRTALISVDDRDRVAEVTEAVLAVPGVRRVNLVEIGPGGNVDEDPASDARAGTTTATAADESGATTMTTVDRANQAGREDDTGAESTPEPSVEQTASMISIVFAEGEAVLSGSVADDSARRGLVRALGGLTPPVLATDELRVGGGEPDERIAALIALLPGLGTHLASGTVELGSQGLSVLGAARSPQALEAVNLALVDARTDDLEVTTAIVVAEAESGANTLQGELDSILARARAADPASVQFPDRGTDLSAPSKAVLDQVAKALARFPDTAVSVRGHTNSVGSDGLNQRLSQARADAVVDYLVDSGIEPGRLCAVGMGESEPLVSNNTVEGRSVNRRVDFQIVA